MVRADGPAVAAAADGPEGAPGTGPAGGPEGERRAWVRRWFDWRRGWPLTALGLLVTALLVCHAQVPNAVGNLGSLLETFLPWLGLAVPVLLGLALWRRAGVALVAALLPGAVWLNLFGALLADKGSGPGDFTVLTHNVAAANDDPQGTVRMLTGSGAEIVALEELSAAAAPEYARALAGAFPYHVVEGTVGLWSSYPIDEVEVVDIKMGWTRAFRARVTTPKGPLAVYVAHLPSVRVKFDSGFTAGRRDVSAQALGDAIEHEPLRKVLLLGDLNGTMNDRSLAPITSQLRSAQGAAGDGFGFSWPASFPMARIDQILSKGGLVPTDSRTLPADASDHLAVAADYRY